MPRFIKRLKFRFEVWNRRRTNRLKTLRKPKPGTYHKVGNRTYFVHENGSLERMRD